MVTTAVATACALCVYHIGGAREYEPGRFLAVIHPAHVRELCAEGWRVIPHGVYGDRTLDVVCPHLSDLVT